jgi:polysaccharide biosynthesis protein PslH
MGGDEREHLGFVEAAVAADLLSALVVPVDADPAAVGREDDLPAIARLVDPAPLITVPRRRSLVSALHGRLPYVVASRPAPAELADQVRRAAPNADGIVVFAYKSHELGRVLAESLGLPAVVRFHNLEGVYHHSRGGRLQTAPFLGDAPRSGVGWPPTSGGWSAPAGSAASRTSRHVHVPGPSRQ